MSGYLYRYCEYETKKPIGFTMPYDDELTKEDLAVFLKSKRGITSGKFIVDVIEPDNTPVQIQPHIIEIKEKGEKKSKKSSTEAIKEKLSKMRMDQVDDMQEKLALKSLERQIKELQDKLEEDEENFDEEDEEALDGLYDKLEEMQKNLESPKQNQPQSIGFAELMMMQQQENARMERERQREERKLEIERRERQDEKEQKRLEYQERLDREEKRWRQEQDERRAEREEKERRFHMEMKEREMQFQASLQQNKPSVSETIAAVAGVVMPVLTPFLQKMAEPPKDPLGEAAAQMIPLLVSETSKAQVETQGKMMTTVMEMMKNPPTTPDQQIAQMQAYANIASELAPAIGNVVGQVMRARKGQSPPQQQSAQSAEETETENFQKRLGEEMQKVANSIMENLDKEENELVRIVRETSPWACEVAKTKIAPEQRPAYARQITLQMCDEFQVKDQEHKNKIIRVVTRMMSGE